MARLITTERIGKRREGIQAWSCLYAVAGVMGT